MEDNAYYIDKWLKGTLTVEERAKFEKTQEYHQLEKLSRHLETLKAPDYIGSTEYQELRSKLNTELRQDTKVIIMPIVQNLLRVAAVITLFAVTYYIFLKNESTIVRTLAESTQEIALPDESKVTLRPGSELEFTKSDWTNDRKVLLLGEAYFQVSKGSRFQVQTNSGTVSVLGTRFSVKARQEILEIICYEGSVQVDAYNQTTVLIRGHVFKALDGKIVDNNLEQRDLEEWSAKECSFHSIPFKFVLAEFERQYGYTVKAEGVDAQQLFSGKFPNSDINTALKAITIPLNLKYKILPNKTVRIWGASQ